MEVLVIYFIETIRYINMKRSNDDLIKAVSEYKNLSDLRKGDHNLYLLMRRRGLIEHLPPKEVRSNDKCRTLPSMLFRGTQLTGTGGIICGRCLEEKEPSASNKNICKPCYNRIINLSLKGLDTNKWNIKDIFVNTKITHNEKVFYIGARVDEKTQDYLSKVGYSFIFKEEYDR